MARQLRMANGDQKSSVLEDLITPAELAKILGVSVAWVRDHTTRHTPKLPGIPLGGRWRYKPSEIAEWLRKQGIGRNDAA